ncbi:sigma factor-like helix-turn-helix DNA-binding protein [Chengkuizengella sp. SCS-71B]|uniref:sigma factor-like helix-turn-helix DNA-binding protein n=1 Tax=Chengkuizengella sp. SCS-71B TaxID=3115290 RepID=UPI0032C24462
MKISLKKMKNPILKNFFKEEKHKIQYEEYLKTGDLSYLLQLETSFKEYYYRVRVLNYFNKYLYFKAIKFDMNQRKLQQRFQLILDKSNDIRNNYILNSIEDKKAYFNVDEMNIEIEDLVTNEQLRNSISKLTILQKKVIYFYYIKEMKDIEIANKLNISRQSISKTRNTAIKKLRKDFGINKS